jgi:hypothetical protein
MNSRSFSLKPFPSAGLLPDLEITGSIERHSNILSISYELSGAMDELILPASADVRVRKNGLWEETCFEFFLGVKGSERYWEFNLSSAGHWNVYSFKSYRQGMREEPAFTSLPFSVELYSNSLQLSLGLEVDKVILPQQVSEVLQVAISAVIKTIDGKTTFWALAHPAPQADFHRRDGFIIEL